MSGAAPVIFKLPVDGMGLTMGALPVKVSPPTATGWPTSMVGAIPVSVRGPTVNIGDEIVAVAVVPVMLKLPPATVCWTITLGTTPVRTRATVVVESLARISVRLILSSSAPVLR